MDLVRVLLCCVMMMGRKARRWAECDTDFLLELGFRMGRVALWGCFVYLFFT